MAVDQQVTIIKDGLPGGWFIQQRSDEESLLCRKNFQGLNICICLKPKLQSHEVWLERCKHIIKGMMLVEKLELIERDFDDPVQP